MGSDTNDFTVPDDMHAYHVVATGGRGGDEYDNGAGATLGYGGPGAVVTTDLTVKPGSDLTEIAGSVGGRPDGGTAGGSQSGGSGGTSSVDSNTQGGGGGGASFVSENGTVLVAAGGGGGGGGGRGGDAGANGGSASAGSVTAGGDGDNGGDSYGGKGGGSTGGAGGTGAGGAGGAGVGQVGGSVTAAADAGGGGGGYAGGGAGGASSSGSLTGGGGAGSSYAVTAYTVSSSSDGAGSVVLSCQSADITSSDDAQFTVQQPGSFTITILGIPTDQISLAGGLPAGLSFHDNGDGTATISGTPDPGTIGTSIVEVTTTNPNSQARQMLTVEVGQIRADESLNADPGDITYGDTEQFTWTGTIASDNHPPTRTVSLYDRAASADIAGCTDLPITVTNGQATVSCSTDTLPPGSDDIEADVTYTNPDYRTGKQGGTTVDVAKRAVALTPETPDAVTYGAEPTVTASVSPVEAGTLQFAVDGNDVGSPVTVGDDGSVTSPPLTGPGGEPLDAGDHTVTETFTPTDTTHFSGDSEQVPLTVDKASTATAVQVAPSTLIATVTTDAPGAGDPTGSVEFFVDGTSVGTATLTSGTATLDYTVPAGATRRVAAVYAGSTDFAGSSASTSRKDPTLTAKVTSTRKKSSYGWYRTRGDRHVRLQAVRLPADHELPIEGDAVQECRRPVRDAHDPCGGRRCDDADGRPDQHRPGALEGSRDRCA